MSARTWLHVGRLDLVERQTRKPASSASGELESETVSGPTAPATKRGRPVLLAMRSAHSRHCLADLFVDFPGEVVEKFVFDDTLIKRRVLAAALFARVFHKKFTLADAGGGKGIGLDDVRARFKKAPMNVANTSGPG